MEIKIPGVRKLRERSERGNPLSAATEKPHLDYYHEQSIESSFSASYFLKSGKPILRCANDRRDPLSLLGERHENPKQVSLTRKLSTMEPRIPL